MGLLLCVRHGIILRASICLGGWSSPYDTVSFVISRLGHSGIVLASGVRDGDGCCAEYSLFQLERVGMRLLL